MNFPTRASLRGVSRNPDGKEKDFEGECGENRSASRYIQKEPIKKNSGLVKRNSECIPYLMRKNSHDLVRHNLDATGKNDSQTR